MFSLGATVSLATVVFAESESAHLLSHVELVGNRGGAGVEPVVVIGSQLTEASGLNILGPLLIHIDTEVRRRVWQTLFIWVGVSGCEESDLRRGF